MSDYGPFDAADTLSPTPGTQAKDELSSELPPQPPIGIIHILFWTAGCAVLMATYRWIDEPEGFEANDATFRAVVYVLYGILYGTALGGPVLFIYRKLTGGVPFPVQPGHWILLATGCASIAGWTGYAITLCLRSPSDLLEDNLAFWAVFNALTHGVHAGCMLGAGLSYRREMYWRLYFWVEMAASLVTGAVWLPLLFLPNEGFVFSVTNGLFSCSSVIFSLWLVIAIIADLAKSRRRDWLHWLGVVVAFGGALLFWFQHLWYRFADAFL